jgi:mono/diheme cytochrome c family protein
MRGSVHGLVALSLGIISASGSPRAASSQTPVPRPSPEISAISARKAVLDQYCVTCHNQRLKTGGLSLDALDLANVPASAEAWEKVVRKLRLGVMPPQGVRRPDRATYDSLIGWLEETLDSAAATHPNPGLPVLHRMNRAEYANAIRDLFGLNVDVTSLLPPDDAAYGFDNVADALGTSPALLQAYLAAARKISTVAVGDPRIRPGSDTYFVRQDLSQDQHLEGLPLGTLGGLVARHVFPVDGDYDFQVRLYRTNLNAIRGLQDPHQVELTLDGERLLLANVGGDEDLVPLQQNPTDTSDAIEAKRLRVRVFVKAGQREVSAAFLGETPSLFETSRLQPFIRDFGSPYAAEGAPHVQSITIQGPYDAKASAKIPAKSANAPSARVFLCRPPSPDGLRPPSPASTAATAGRRGAASIETACARQIISTLARRAYRRPVSKAEIAVLLSFYQQERSSGSFETAIEFSVRRILASPSFVFRPEDEPADLPPGTPYRIKSLELASRLSFFLWSSVPDEELLRVAGDGRLAQPQMLARQARRMLADPRSDAFVSNFAGQWLQLRNLRGMVPNSETFPDFDDNLRQAFGREAELFFDSIVREDRNVLDLMTADYTFVNERLAKHYGIPDVVGSNFRRVQLTDTARRGLLGKGAVLLVTSHATTTSPVLRGKWILENVLGAPPPPPPPDVPALSENGPGAPRRTMREQMEEHRANPACAGCHKSMDPYGFALENFDAVGAWRATYEAGATLNTVDALPDGTKVDGVVTLRQALLKRPDVFVQTVAEKLLVYALGRGLTPQDMPVVRKIVRDSSQRDYRFSSLILGIVNSAPFQMRMKPVAED